MPNFGFVFALLYGPLLFNFVRIGRNDIRKIRTLHFLPAILLTVWICFFYFKDAQTTLLELQLLRSIATVQFLAYLVNALQILKGKEFKKHQNNFEKTKKRPIEIAFIILGTIYLMALLEWYLGSFFKPQVTNILHLALAVTLLIGLFSLLYQGLIHRFVFNGMDSEKKISLEPYEKYASSPLTHTLSETYLAQLQNVMKEQKPYRDFTLNLEQLSAILNIPPRHVSQVINEKLHQNFYDFINSYRIEDASQQLQDSSKRISEVMYEVGFGSRSSFNLAFKKFLACIKVIKI